MSEVAVRNVRTIGKGSLNVAASREVYLPTWTPDVVVLGYGGNDPVTLDAGGGYNNVDDKLVIWIRSGYTQAQASSLFNNNSSKTGHIRVQYSSIEATEFTGYTQLEQITTTVSGMIQVILAKTGGSLQQG